MASVALGVSGRVVASRLSLVLSAVAIVHVATPPAAAQSWFPWDNAPSRDRGSRERDSDERERERPRRSYSAPKPRQQQPASAPVERFEPTKPGLASKPASSHLLAVVSLSSQHVTLYDHTGGILQSPVSTGQAGHRTPTGVFSVIQKHRFHASNIYSGAPMPYMQRITWSGIAMHSGRLPGYPASHGCIRLPDGVAAKLFGMSKMGMRVVITPSDVRATKFSHPALPEPLLTPAVPLPAAVAPDAASAGAAPAAHTGLVNLASAASTKTGDATATDATIVETKLENPKQRAIAARAKAAADVTAASKAVKTRTEDATRTNAAADKVNAQLRAATTERQDAEAQRTGARAAELTAITDEDKDIAAKKMAAAEVQVAASQVRLDELENLDVAHSKDVFAAGEALREAQEAAEAAKKAAKLAEKAGEPISVFVSRKERKLYVRQGFLPVLDAPVTFKDDGPVGTHLYVALDADEVSGKLAWTSVSVPASSGDPEDRQPVKRGRQPAPEPTGPASTAAKALERVDIAPDLKQWIAERIWLGSSLIISDHGISGETGLGTDFVVLTK